MYATCKYPLRPPRTCNVAIARLDDDDVSLQIESRLISNSHCFDRLKLVASPPGPFDDDGDEEKRAWYILTVHASAITQIFGDRILV